MAMAARHQTRTGLAVRGSVQQGRLAAAVVVAASVLSASAHLQQNASGAGVPACGAPGSPLGACEGWDEQDEQLVIPNVFLLQSERRMHSKEGWPGPPRAVVTDLTMKRPGSEPPQDGAMPAHFHKAIALLGVLVCPVVLVQLAAVSTFATGMKSAVLSDYLTGKSKQVPASPQSQQRPQLVPTVVMWFSAVGSLIQNMNFAIALPASNDTMVRVGGSTFMSGLCIGAYALGALLSMPFVVYFSRHWYKGSILFMAWVSVLGNALYAAMGTQSGTVGIVGLILARAVCGLEGGVMIVFAKAAMQLSTGMGTVNAIANITICGYLGLTLGPALSSLSQLAFPGLPLEVPPAAVMATCAGVYGLLALLLFPGQSECFELAGQRNHRPGPDPTALAVYPTTRLQASWLYVVLYSVVMVARFILQVSWEAGILLVLEKEYGFSVKVEAFLIFIPVLSSLPLVCCAGSLQKLGAAGAMRMISLVELAGILLMVRAGEPSPVSTSILLMGSSLFYGANWISCMPLATLGSRFALPGHPVLNAENVTSITWFLSFLGYLYGPVVSRSILSVCMHQNLLAVLLFCGWLGCFLAVELGLPSLLQSIGEHGEAPKRGWTAFGPDAAPEATHREGGGAPTPGPEVHAEQRAGKAVAK